MSPYRVAPIKPYEPRPRTWTGRLRSLWRKALVWNGGTWRSRFCRCSTCGAALPIGDMGARFSHYVFAHPSLPKWYRSGGLKMRQFSPGDVEWPSPVPVYREARAIESVREAWRHEGYRDRDSEAPPSMVESAAIATMREAVLRMGVNAAPIAAKLSGWTNDGGPW